MLNRIPPPATGRGVRFYTLSDRMGTVGPFLFARAPAANPQAQVLQWLKANGCPYDASACAVAARKGHLEVLQWCRNNGFPWDERVCSAAALRGDYEMLTWARSRGCPWHDLRFCRQHVVP